MQTEEAVAFAVRTHNGTITVRNPASGQHRTFRIRTQKKDASFAPGKRVLSMLTGSDNENSYTPFAFVMPDGRVLVWRKHLGTQFERLGRLMMHLDEECRRHGLEVLWSAKCRCCNRKLTTPDSIASGIGPVCGGDG